MKKFLIIPLMLSLPISVVCAFEEAKTKTTLEKMTEPKISLETTFIGDSDIDGSGGFETTKHKVSVYNFYAGLSYTNNTFKWNNIGKLPFGDGVSKPIEQIHTIELEGKLPYHINDQWLLLTSLSLTSSFEQGMDDSYSYGLYSFASYKLDEDHTFQFGFFGNYHTATSMVLPIVSYSYRVTHRDGFKFVFGFPRTYVGYHVNRDTLVSLGIVYSQSAVKLSRTSVVEKNGFVETVDYMANIGVTYEFAKDFQIRADILYGLDREFLLYNSRGKSTEDYKVESAIGANIKLTYAF
ncbi:MAG: hypothetical protein PHS42_09965 [Sulfurimonas sp.]|nr:hypothetical protein [Sulfurimonas sp.]MDD3835778.1 hypothetical protein [Sulfurimonas sp.]